MTAESLSATQRSIDNRGLHKTLLMGLCVSAVLHAAAIAGIGYLSQNSIEDLQITEIERVEVDPEPSTIPIPSPPPAIKPSPSSPPIPNPVPIVKITRSPIGSKRETVVATQLPAPSLTKNVVPGSKAVAQTSIPTTAAPFIPQTPNPFPSFPSKLFRDPSSNSQQSSGSRSHNRSIPPKRAAVPVVVARRSPLPQPSPNPSETRITNQQIQRKPQPSPQTSSPPTEIDSQISSLPTLRNSPQLVSKPIEDSRTSNEKLSPRQPINPSQPVPKQEQTNPTFDRNLDATEPRSLPQNNDPVSPRANSQILNSNNKPIVPSRDRTDLSNSSTNSNKPGSNLSNTVPKDRSNSSDLANLPAKNNVLTTNNSNQNGNVTNNDRAKTTLDGNGSGNNPQIDPRNSKENGRGGIANDRPNLGNSNGSDNTALPGNTARGSDRKLSIQCLRNCEIRYSEDLESSDTGKDKILVKVTIDANGMITNAEIDRSSGNQKLDRATLAGVKQMQFAGVGRALTFRTKVNVLIKN